MEYKYTSDGKKVVVVGKLNAQETIVQEVFVSGDAEIASGENFVVKSLHDQPVESWKEKRLRELEDRYETNRRKYNSLIDGARKNYYRENKTISALLKNARQVKNNLNNEAFDDLLMFLSGEVKFIAKHGYSYEITPFEKAIEEGEFDALKLISLFGNSDGNLSWRLHRWSDGSGSSHSNIIPCRSIEDAKAVIESAIEKNIEKYSVNDHMINAKKKYELLAPSKDQESEFYTGKINNIKSSISKLDKDIEKKQAEINAIIESLQ